MGAAALGAAGSIAGAAIGGKGAKKAARTQQKNMERVLAEGRQYYADAQGRYQGDINLGDKASAIHAGLLGTGGDPVASARAIETWKNSNNYQSVSKAADEAVLSNAYARGMGRSGAAFKALQDRRGEVANAYQQQYLGNLGTEMQLGSNAKAALTGVGTNTLNANTAAMNKGADAKSNSQLAIANGWANAVRDISSSLGSSFKKEG